MKERPILFNDEMVRAILDGRKTQTRRVAKVETCDTRPLGGGHVFITPTGCYSPRTPEHHVSYCPYGQPGDRLWVRETFRVIDGQTQPRIAIDYRADPEDKWCRIGDFLGDGKKWRPSIHMPRWASRILLEITNVRVERVQEISVADAKAEGVCGLSARAEFLMLWDSINAKRGFGWDANPWVWVIEFRRTE
jgi:hypothetical protein